MTELKTEILFEGSDDNEEQQEFLTTFEDCDSAPIWEFFSNGDLESRDLEIDIDDGSCSVSGLVSTDTWERIDDNTIQINEADNNETINLDVSITGNNQAELTGEQIEANKVFEFTIFMSPL